jgi:hypothetical protein
MTARCSLNRFCSIKLCFISSGMWLLSTEFGFKVFNTRLAAKPPSLLSMSPRMLLYSMLLTFKLKLGFGFECCCRSPATRPKVLCCFDLDWMTTLICEGEPKVVIGLFSRAYLFLKFKLLLRSLGPF